MMEAQEEEVVMMIRNTKFYNKGKRTKRQRSVSPLSLTMATTTSESSGDDSRRLFDCHRPTPSPEYYSKEEEDMAKCLILLAQRPQTHSRRNLPESSPSYLYECKTCNRCFPSFQALGGHRASHKKPKASIEEKISHKNHHDEEEKKPENLQERECKPLCLNNKSRIHQCSVCGAGFTSGQALGGHMRRHRPMPTAPASYDQHHDENNNNNNSNNSHVNAEANKKPRNNHLLSLDLNLPAEPEDDHLRREPPRFSFSLKEKVIVFSSSPALVDCHY